MPCLPNAEDVPLLTVDQVVRASGGALKRSATYEAIRRGQIASVKVGRKTFIPTAALRRLWGLDDENPRSGGGSVTSHQTAVVSGPPRNDERKGLRGNGISPL